MELGARPAVEPAVDNGKSEIRQRLKSPTLKERLYGHNKIDKVL